MPEAMLGRLASKGSQRDAIHVAIVPVVAAMSLSSGEHIGLDSERKASIHAKKIGIVDPFLAKGVEAGELFYLVLYPNTVTGMRHHWFHSDFTDATDAPSGKEASIAWLKDAAKQLGVSYETLVSDYSELVHGDYIDNGEHIRDVWYELSDEFWEHRKIVTGADVPERNRGGFTCSC
jgi:hypothetical protein